MTNDSINPAKLKSERRRFRRHPALKLKAEVKIKKGLFGQWVDVEPRDYSKRGMAIETEYAFEPEQPITLNITLEMEIGDIQITKIEGIIKNKLKDTPTPRYGVEFDYTANRHMKTTETQSQLGRIEGILERSENLRLRIEDR
ncbi:PilZ domain-containing protein [Alkalimarinus alittae]|uniref:PilZ domain-containing protein n=1 Tax=Alkalimarinus alittae TaxID=2961619 RepID=A0ABY6N1M5_9ALTE|nr:PilZ domain-containing protein [Alkalimarinus alittae]UZE95984.1 PilZ domain-containing protein [Alkalimarinus alittae]